MHVRFSSMLSFMTRVLPTTLVGVWLVFGLFTASPAVAAQASAKAIMDAISEGTRAGVCSPTSQTLGSDCKKTSVTCSASDWAKYVASRYQNQGGSIGLVAGGTVKAGRSLSDSEVTSDISSQAVAILSRHRAAFKATCDGQCPTSLSGCGMQKEYPFISGGKQYVGKITEHTNKPGGAATSVGCPHPGVSVFLGVTSSGGDSSGGGNEALAYLQADWDRNSKAPPGPVLKSSCYCQCQAGDTNAVCTGKTPGFPYFAGEDLTFEQCAASCGTHPVATEKCSVPPTVPAGAFVVGPSSPSSDALCFTPSECAEQEGYFEPGGGCDSGGKCYAAEPEVQLNTPIGGVTKIRGFNNYVIAAYRYLISIVAVAATVMFTWGAFLFLLGSALPSITKGKQLMIDAVVGLILVLSATAILRTINPATTNLNPIKVYLINTVQFSNVAYCRDVPGSSKLAYAGTKPNLTPYEEVAKDTSAFSVEPKKAKCGSSYWIKDAVGSACDGSACPGKGEACVSCADGSADDCKGQRSTKMVCQKTVFAGSVTYADSRHPEEVYLLLMCNSAQNNDPDIVEDNWTVVSAGIGKVGFKTGGNTTDEDVTGQAVYRFDLEDLDDAIQECGGSGNFRGALLGVQYNDDSVKPETRALGSAFLALVTPVGAAVAVATAARDDFAILSKANCGAPRAAFDGYDSGDASNSDKVDLAEAVSCAFPRGKLLDGPGTYWKEAELKAALEGDAPITCDFTLNRNTAPSDPGRICTAK